MKIRIITKPSKAGNPDIPDGEIIWEDRKNSFSPVEIITALDGKKLKIFLQDWNQFYVRTMQTNLSKDELNQKLFKKSQSLEQIVFGNKELPWKTKQFKSEIFLQTDPEFTSYPWEILRTDKDFFFERPNFYRGIRSNRRFEGSALGKTFLLIQNPVLKELEQSVKKESSQISTLFEDDKSYPLRRIRPENLQLPKFWEEISEASLLHYSGHTEKTGIPFPKDDIVLGEEIGQAKLSNLNVVFLNSCHSAFEGEKTTGLASQFLNSGAKHVLGFLTPIETELAEKIGFQFWKSFKKTKNVQKSFRFTKTLLLKGNSAEILSSLSFVCFAPEEKNKFKNILFIFLFCLLLLIGLFFFEASKNRSTKLENYNLPESKNIEKNTKINEEKPKKIILDSRIASLKNPQFRNQIYTFLNEENPLLSKSERKQLVEEILSGDENEEMKYYHFKIETGIN
ncbi:MAG: CHAT domain-containing protein [Leptospira sp.]|nr:CHAT domain-containing protein [Leptospira sp.]